MNPLLWSILLLLLGLSFIVLEVYVPSAGMLGVMAGLSVLGAIVVAFTGGPKLGVAMLIAATTLVPISVGFAIRVWPYTPIGRRVIMPKMNSEDVLPDGEYAQLKTLIGRRGVVKSKMLPSGLILLDGKPYDATSEGMAIDAGQTVRVVAVRTNRLIVRPSSEPPDAPTSPAPTPLPSDPLAQSLESLGLDSLGLDSLDEPHR